VDALTALLKKTAEERLLLAPALGWYRGALPEGAGVVADQQIATLTILGRIYPLLAPRGSTGTVVECCLSPGLHAVEYGQELYRLGESAAPRAAAEEESGGDGLAEISAREIAVRSPTEGVFYRRPDPQSAPYVQVGDVVELGHPLGLVEVMKCFNQVRYAGHDLPPRARVKKILVEDSAEIRHDQVLFLLEAEA
jgi:biotin carboxyl carrier protein